MPLENPELLFILIVIAAVALVLITTASQHRRHALRTNQRLCAGCGTSHPSYARFCRRCGRDLGNGGRNT